MTSLVLVGGNLVADTAFRKKLAGRDTGVELQIVLEDLVASWPAPATDTAEASEAPVIVEKLEGGPGGPGGPPTEGQDQYLPRDQLKITLKVFLHEATVASLHAAVTAALAKLSTNRVDTLFVATPPEMFPLVGIGSGASGQEQDEARQQLLELWRGVEHLISEGKVGGAGLSDLHPPVFFSIYNEATIKPTSIQVNLRSCCVVPEELAQFVAERGVTLLTHSDPSELLPGDSLRSMLYPKLSGEASHYSAAWIARYQVHLKDRGVLLQKRYLVNIRHENSFSDLH